MECREGYRVNLQNPTPKPLLTGKARGVIMGLTPRAGWLRKAVILMNVGMGGEHMKRERSDLLKRRPNIIRYYFCVVSEDNSIHTGTTYSALLRAHKKSPIRLMFISDIATGAVVKAEEPVEHFLLRWRYHYSDPEWNYQKDLDEGQPIPKEGN